MTEGLESWVRGLAAAGLFTGAVLTMAPGGFFVFGCLIALVNKISKGKAPKRKGLD